MKEGSGEDEVRRMSRGRRDGMRRGRMDGRSMRICAANHKNDTSTVPSVARITTMFPILSRTKLPSNATQNKSVVAKHDDHTIWNETTPGRKSVPSDSLKTSLWGVVGDVTTSPICFPFARQIPAFLTAFPQKDISHLHITCPHPPHINANKSPTSPLLQACPARSVPRQPLNDLSHVV